MNSVEVFPHETCVQLSLIEAVFDFMAELRQSGSEYPLWQIQLGSHRMRDCFVFMILGHWCGKLLSVPVLSLDAI